MLKKPLLLNTSIVISLVFLMLVSQFAVAQDACVQQKFANGDPCESQQWHLTGVKRNSNEPAVHINIKDVKYKGENMIIGVIDTGVLVIHPDLQANILFSDPDLKKDILRNILPTARRNVFVIGSDFPLSAHGTQVAGVIAAVEKNGIGGKGVAPKAKIFGAHNRLSSLTSLVDALTQRHGDVAVYNNSWGITNIKGKGILNFIINNIGGAFVGGGSLFRLGVYTGLTEGFNGKGSVYVFGAGNDHCTEEWDCGYRNSNYNGYANHYGVVTVGAITDGGWRKDYSEMGANLWICAPSGIFTTSYKGLYRSSYDSNFDGTSAAAPQGVRCSCFNASSKSGTYLARCQINSSSYC